MTQSTEPSGAPLRVMIFPSTHWSVVVHAGGIAGGGGQASGGGWTLNATIGQPVAGITGGGAMVLNAGFWTAEMPGPPTLEITRAGSNVILSWPSAATGFNLQQTPALAASTWIAINAVPFDDGVTKSVTLPITNSLSFYLLAR